MAKYKIEIAPAGYRRISNKPTRQDLREYYREKYYQEGRGSYELEYSASEIEYFRNRQRAYAYCLESFLGKSLPDSRIIDLGCGEGWTVAHFSRMGCHITGVDFSSFGFHKFNPEHIKHLHECDLYDFVEHMVKDNEKYDIVFLNNVVEHVIDPEFMLQQIRCQLADQGVLIITFPNDFSPLQDLLCRQSKIADEFWVAPPDHLSYFNKSTMASLCRSLNLEPKLWLADFPIDLFLLNDHANYIKDKSKGKQAHFARVECTNLLYRTDFESTVKAFIELGNAGFGRDLTTFITCAQHDTSVNYEHRGNTGV